MSSSRACAFGPRGAGARAGGPFAGWCGAALCLALAASCSRNAPAPAAPAPAVVEPPGGYTKSAVAVRIRGDSFVPAIDQQLGGGSHLEVSAAFRAWLGATELSSVQWIDATSLTALVPAGLASGIYPLTVEGPYGRGVLDAAFRASDREPAELSAAATAPARVAVGAEFEVVAQVRNSGGTAALQVSGGAPAVSGATIAATSLPAEALTLAPGAAATLRWRLRASTAGNAAITLPIGGRDEVTAARLALSPRVSVEAVAPAALEATALPSRATVETGQPFVLQADVKNTGADLARGVALSAPAGLELISGPAPQDLAGGATLHLELSVRAQAPGLVQLSSRAAGTAALDGSALAAPVRWTDVKVESPPALSATSVTLVPGARAAIGQEVVLTVAVANAGDGTATLVTPALQVSGTGGLTPLSATAPADLAGHAAASFVYRFRAASAGTAAFALQFSATDANTLAALSFPVAAPAPLVIEAPAALVAQATGPQRATVGQTFRISLAVQNTGGAAALAVLPAAPSVPSALSPVATPAAADIPGGTAASFVWTYRASAEGTATFAASVSGTDADTGMPVSATAAPIAIVVERPAALEIRSFTLPASISRGQSFTATLVVANTGGATATGLGASRPIATATGGAAVSFLGQVGPTAIAGGATATLSFSCLESGAGPGDGTLSLSTSVSAVDADSGAPLDAGPASTATAAVQAAAALSITAFTLPARVSSGQQFEARMTVVNAGTAVAMAVTPSSPSVLATGSAKATLLAWPAPADVPHGSTTFVWTYRESGTGAGTIQLHAGAAGTDANSGAAVVAHPQDSTAVAVDVPAALAVTAIGVPGSVSRGQAFVVTVKVSNAGQATASGVAPSLAVLVEAGGPAATPSGAAPAPVDLPGGSSAVFAFGFVESGSSPGRLAFEATAAGTDANSGAQVAAPAVRSGSLPVEQAAALAITSFSIPPALSAGQTFTATLVATNQGGTAALSVLPEAPVVSAAAASSPGSPAATVISAPTALDLAPGASRSFTWTYAESGSGPGTLALATSLHGTDANSGAAVSAGPQASNVSSVVAGARLAITAFTLPPLISRGQTVTAILTVQNTGGAAALGVLPVPDPPTVQPSGGAGLAPASGATNAVDVGPGASATFRWSYVENGSSTGTVRLRAGMQGADANSGQPVLSGRADSTRATVQTPASLSITSLAIDAPQLSRGQAFTATMTVANTGQASATLVSPNPSPPSRLLAGGADAATSSAQAPITVAGGQTVQFVWSYLENGSGPGSIALSAAVRGADANSGAALSTAAATSLDVQVQSPARLEAQITAPAFISRGQTFVVPVVVRNSGGAIARGVRATPSISASGGASASTSSAPAPVDLAPGASATFSFTCVEGGTASGGLSFSATATGTDANSTAAVQSAQVRAQVTVQRQAALSAVFSMPATLTRGQTFSATLVVTNTGEAAAAGVVPGAVTVTPTGQASAATSTPQGAVTIAGGASASFSWTFVEDGSGTGTLQLQATTTGTDGNDPSVALSAPASTGTATVVQPSRLSISAFVIPAQLTRGQTFTASMRLTNNGGSAVNNVSPGVPAVTTTGGASASTSTAQSPISIAAGGSATFTWTFVEGGSGPGTLSLAAGASGVDAVSGVPVNAASTSTGVAQVQTAASLTIASFTIPPALDRGQSFLARLIITNQGQAVARSVSLSSLVVVKTGGANAAVVLPAAQDIAAGGSATFQWTLTESGAGPGTLALQAVAQGVDGNSGAAISSAQAATSAAAVQDPAALRVVSLSAPQSLSRGQAFTVTLVVANSGGATARGVLPSPLTPAITATGGALAQTSTAPAAATIAGGQSASFVWSFVENGSATGSLTFTAGAAGTDANTGAALSAPAGSATSTVQRPAALAVSSFTLRSSAGTTSIDRGQAFLATLVVTNTGDASAAQVTPNPTPPLLSASGGAAATTASSAAPATIAGGGSATFTWAYVENGASAGTLSASAGAQGLDANSGATLGAATAASNALAVQEPAALAITSFTIPAALSRGQRFTATMVVANRGGATANAVQPGAPVVNATGLAHAGTSSSPAAATIAAGSSVTFSWTFTEDGSGDGALSLTAGASGADANTGAALTVPATTTGTATVQRGAALTAVLAAPRTVSRGQSFTVSLTVTNTGAAAATLTGPSPAAPTVTPSGGAAASTSSTATPVTLAGGASATFAFTFVENGGASGALVFGGGATGTDANSGLVLQAQAQAVTTAVQKPALLTITSFTATSSTGGVVIERGQGFTARLVVANQGEASASLVAPRPSPPALATTGGTAATASGTAQPATIDAGASATFVWNYVENGAGAGTITLSAGAAGVDANSGAAVTAATATTAALTVQQPPALAAAISAPSLVKRQTPFNVTMTASNSGGTGVLAAAPTLTIAGTAGASIQAGPAPTTANVPAGGQATFTWSVTAASNGSLTLSGSVGGSDAISGGQVSATAAPVSLQVAEAQGIAINPFGDGTGFSYLFSHLGQIYLGPDKTGAGAVRMNADGSSPRQVPWKLEAGPGAANTAYHPVASGGQGLTCTTIGAAGCAPNTAACGPDNEAARGLFFSGTIGGVDWYGGAGEAAGGGARFLYLTNGLFPLAPGGRDDLAFVDLSSATGAPAAARTLTAAHVFRDKLYLGILETGQRSPFLLALSTLPPLPGLVATGADLANLGGQWIPRIGTKSTLFNTSQNVDIDSIADFNDALYLGNNGGLARTTSNAPAACSASSCTGWVDATPSSLAYLTQTSVTNTATASIQPAMRALPFLVPFGGQLFAGRNTASGPQLWACDPAQTGSPTQCDPGDWRLVAAPQIGTGTVNGDVTQFGNLDNTAVTLLAATPSALYIGLDNAKNGVQIFRTTLPTASLEGDFTGQGGCLAATPGCQGVGGDGLAAGLQRIYDSRALAFAGQDFVYLLAAGASGTAAVFRIAP